MPVKNVEVGHTHLRSPLWVDERASLDGLQSGGRESPDQINFDIRRDG